MKGDADGRGPFFDMQHEVNRKNAKINGKKMSCFEKMTCFYGAFVIE